MLLVIIILLAVAAASPQYFPSFFNNDFNQYHQPMFNPYSGFDGENFFSEFSKGMRQFGEAMQNLYRMYPPSSSKSVTIKDNQYIVKIGLNGFQKKDIEVKIKDGLLMVKAVRNGVQCYLDVVFLPEYVNPSGTWTYIAGCLKIVFPLKSNGPEQVTKPPPVKDPEQVTKPGPVKDPEQVTKPGPVKDPEQVTKPGPVKDPEHVSEHDVLIDD